ncbi:MAG: hypothetical protein Q8P61_09575 [Candidatus Nanopelagicales bacterium]|nr:hypothetical protein [Candidatus Nanopelagicales bacterium]
MSITTKSDSTTYKFTVNVPARTVNPANEPAAEVGEYCSSLSSGG